MARGTNHNYYNGRISITFRKKLFDLVNEKSVRDGTSFAAAVREIVKQHFDNA